MKRISNLFTDHPHSINETYLEHMSQAFYYGFRMIFSGLAALIHAVFPFVFEATASNNAREIIRDIDQRKAHRGISKYPIYYPQNELLKGLITMVGPGGLEPPTNGL